MDAQRAMLDALMGKHRNLTTDEKQGKEQNFDDDDVCQWFNCDYCPHELFTNTKSDLGPCPKDHDPRLKAAYKEAIKKNPRLKYDTEMRYLGFLESLTEEIDKKIRRGHARLNMEAPPGQLSEEKEKERDTLDEQIKALIQQMEDLGEQGRINESQALLKLVEELKVQRAAVVNKTPLGMSLLDDESKRMMVCEICGAMLAQNDAESRVQAHLDGKQHVGFGRLRRTIKALAAQRMSGRPAGSSPPCAAAHRQRSRSPRRRDRHRDRDHDSRRDHRDRDRRRRSRSRSRSGSRSRRRRSHSRSRSRDRRRRY